MDRVSQVDHECKLLAVVLMVHGVVVVVVDLEEIPVRNWMRS